MRPSSYFYVICVNTAHVLYEVSNYRFCICLRIWRKRVFIVFLVPLFYNSSTPISEKCPVHWTSSYFNFLHQAFGVPYLAKHLLMRCSDVFFVIVVVLCIHFGYLPTPTMLCVGRMFSVTITDSNFWHCLPLWFAYYDVIVSVSVNWADQWVGQTGRPCKNNVTL